MILFVIWQRVTIAEILEDEWFKKDYKAPVFEEKENTNLDDVEAVFKDSEVCASAFFIISIKVFIYVFGC